VPLQTQSASLAKLARVSLAEPVTPERDARSGSVLGSLTPREREVLGHLVAGRLYVEIAAALFISEKTVSVHVSNLLRKTGTSSRNEVAALAVRTGMAATDSR
jgi:DNA-binding CsgD family transcriptional regulator